MFTVQFIVDLDPIVYVWLVDTLLVLRYSLLGRDSFMVVACWCTASLIYSVTGLWFCIGGLVIVYKTLYLFLVLIIDSLLSEWGFVFILVLDSSFLLYSCSGVFDGNILYCLLYVGVFTSILACFNIYAVCVLYSVSHCYVFGYYMSGGFVCDQVSSSLLASGCLVAYSLYEVSWSPKGFIMIWVAICFNPFNYVCASEYICLWDSQEVLLLDLNLDLCYTLSFIGVWWFLGWFKFLIISHFSNCLYLNSIFYNDFYLLDLISLFIGGILLIILVLLLFSNQGMSLIMFHLYYSYSFFHKR